MGPGQIVHEYIIANFNSLLPIYDENGKASRITSGIGAEGLRGLDHRRAEDVRGLTPVAEQAVTPASGTRGTRRASIC